MNIKQFAIIIVVLFLLLTACDNDRVSFLASEPTITVSSTNTATITALPTETDIPATITLHPDILLDGDRPLTPTKRPTKKPTITSTPTPNLELSATPVPPLEAHEWIPEMVLASLDYRVGDGCFQYPHHPGLILYLDGQLFIKRYDYDRQYYQLLTKKLERQEICAFLNTIDQLGFFDYDAKTYSIDRYGRPIEDFSIEGSGTQTISVDAWRSNWVSLYALSSYVSEPYLSNIPEDSHSQAPTILPAMKNTFLFIDGYMPEGMAVYQPDAIEIWVGGEILSDDEIRTWPLDELSLEDIINNSEADERYTSCWSPYQSSRKIVLTGAKAEQVYTLFSQAMQSQVFTDGENTVELFVLPVLPYTNESRPTPLTIRCMPSDGEVIWNP